MLLFTLAAVIPPLYLVKKIYRLDRIEPEPVTLLAILFCLGAASTIFAGYIEGFLKVAVLDKAFSIPEGTSIYTAIYFFLIVAWTEEGLKHFIMHHVTWKNPNFNYRFDAIVYSVTTSLGFAALENVGYVFTFGLGTALVRAVTSIPGHCIFGIFMGFYYGIAKQHYVHKRTGRSKFYMALSLIVPILLHGTYNYCASGKSPLMVIIFWVYIIALQIISLFSIRAMAKRDRPL